MNRRAHSLAGSQSVWRRIGRDTSVIIFMCVADVAISVARVESPPQGLNLPVPKSAEIGPGCNALGEHAASDQIRVTRTFYDDFHDFDPNTTRWTLHYHRPNDPVAARTHDFTGEEQIYVDPGYAGSAGRPLGLNPFRVEGKHLAIVARRIDDTLRPALYGRAYSSGMLQTKDWFSQLYGYFEVSLQIPSGRGLWPAFWLVPAAHPNPPELDILEALGDHPEVIYSTIHWDYKDPKNGYLMCRRTVPDAPRRSVAYGVLWTRDITVYYTDRVPVIAVRTHPSMNEALYMILNLTVGGSWPGPTTADTPNEVKMPVDWVAVYSITAPYPPILTKPR